MPSSHLILCRPLPLLPPVPPSIRVFSNESALCMRWPKYWSFSFSISTSNEHPAVISFRMNWLDLLAVQGTLKSLLQHHSSKASIFWCSAFFTVLRIIINISNYFYYYDARECQPFGPHGLRLHLTLNFQVIYLETSHWFKPSVHRGVAIFRSYDLPLDLNSPQGSAQPRKPPSA